MPEPPAAPEPATLRDGRYVLMRVLGQGAQASTHEAVDKRAGRIVAVKRFQVRDAKQWKDVELAEREARVLASLSHPLLPGYVEHFEEDGALYLVMDRVEGVSLVEYVARGGVFGEGDARRLLEDASAALAYLHARTPPIIHRDLKPRNVIRRPDGSFAFVDFGAVRDKLKPEGGSTVVGTFGYMAPEQFQGRAVPASDVYAIGATALWMLVGLEPEDLPHKGLAIDVTAALGPRASPSIVAILAAMLEPDPERRPRSIAPLLAGFEVRGKAVRAGAREPRARPPPPPPSPPPSPSRPPSAPPLVPAVAAAVAGDARERGLATARRLLPVFWILAGLAWWTLDRSTALSFTVGLAIITVVLRAYAPRPEARARAPRSRMRIATPRGAGAAVRVDPRAAEILDEPSDADADADARADARRRRR